MAVIEFHSARRRVVSRVGLQSTLSFIIRQMEGAVADAEQRNEWTLVEDLKQLTHELERIRNSLKP